MVDYLIKNRSDRSNDPDAGDEPAVIEFNPRKAEQYISATRVVRRFPPPRIDTHGARPAGIRLVQAVLFI
jgi:hypothetical protein